MMLCTLFGRAARSLGIFLLLILSVPMSVKTQCPQCTGHYIKTVNVATGKCMSCFPCLRCQDGHMSSVPCGSTVPYGTEIKCVLIQSDPVVNSQTSTQTLHLTATLLISSTPKKIIDTPVTSVTHPVVASATISSSASAQSSIKQNDGSDATKKRKGNKELPLEEWKKHTVVYTFSGIVLAITSVAIVYRFFKWKNSKQLQLRPVDPDSRPATTIPLPDVPSQDREMCTISWPTNTVTFTCHNADLRSEIGVRNQRSHPGVAHASPSSLVAAGGTVNAIQPHNPSVPSLPQSIVNFVSNGQTTGDVEQGRPVNWSALSQRDKYQAKVLEMPFSLLYKICLTLDIQRADGNDVRVLAEKLKISVSDLALLKQAAITQNPDNVYCNSITYVVLTKKSLLTVEDFVSIMNDIEREDIVTLINN